MLPAGTAIGLELRADTIPGASIALVSTSGTDVVDETSTGPDKVARITYLARDGGVYFIRVRGGGREATGTYTLIYTASR
jgi:hypothetical protein